MKQTKIRECIVIALKDGELNPYQIIKRIHTDTGKKVNATTLLRAIRTLEQEGLIKQGSTVADRVCYKLTVRQKWKSLGL